MKRFLILFITFVLTAGSAFSMPQVQKQIDVQPGQKLVVDIECGSDIFIESWDKNIVDVDVNIRGRDEDKIVVDISETSYGILVSADYRHKRNSRSTNGEVKIKVPRKFDLDLETMGGELVIENVDGELEGTTMGGQITLKKLKGEIDFKTMGGAIELTDSEVDGEVNTMGGSVLVENVVGDVNASTMGGSVTQRNVKSKSSHPDSDEIKIKSMGGSIDLDEAKNGANVSTMGGSININDAANFVIAETMGGDIKIDRLDGWVEASTMGGDIELLMVGTDDRRDIDLSSMGGDIIVTVPADLSMDIFIEIKYDEDDAGDVDVISDFNLTEKIEKDDEDGWDDDDMILTARGKTGDGKNTVTIKTIAGKVYLKKG